MPVEHQGRICDFPRPGRRGEGRGRMATAKTELWRERLTVPAYRVIEAARYARTSSQTIGNWQHLRGNHGGAISLRDAGDGLSYLQLIEVGVVAAMRKSGVTLARIREAREYLKRQFGTDYPFARYRFKTDGKSLLMDYNQVAKADKNKLLALNESGQLAWNEILSALLHEFEYDAEIGTVLRWRVDGYESPIRLDPRVAFGAPHVGGVAAWVLRGRWESGEGLTDIAEDYDLTIQDVAAALRFERVNIDPDRPNKWIH